MRIVTKMYDFFHPMAVPPPFLGVLGAKRVQKIHYT